MRTILAGLCLLAVLSNGALVATSSGILYQQEKAADGAVCSYFTGTGTFTTPSYAVTGCPRFIIVDR
ncbi:MULTISPECIES: hypothetical protein [Mesorhizobium]|uniref:Secreted protein n=2 Tax=Mesorhizobium TaxID=68287 RepID=A0ABU5AJT2_9HYPH|nr:MULTISPECIES: hypothetical protein [Mesorhizobium]RUX64927.1 hypothetical protein EOA25_42600 [Mesorhizobium sp. M2A.F.Ca.ET.040.01.1.1]RVC59989.1 hypothetical protein EN779_14630 [Mesorhizobium sp. M4B.F.Ca.ET.088.02.2.1]RVD35041.1 hypothetical protein EN741_28725 [Mesorhizobium sp. M4B.F.Ca.ET.019.03.1.1]MDX8434440.1 hypothetical protein [Mesorhizobium abyssinicae]MDX8537553.1 hypothetical protein [Mesorhizobium abyssinicae]